MSRPSTYFEELTQAITEGWNRFWFTASDPCVAGLLRLLTGGLLLWVLATYSTQDLERFWGPGGFQNNEVVDQTNAARTRPSFWRLTDDANDFPALHYASLAVAALFAVGFYSRVTTVLATVVALSYFHRSPQLTTQLEPMLSLLLVYLCLAPSGAAFSLDAWLAAGRKKPAPSHSATIAIRLIQLHVTLAVLMSALGKVRGDVWWDGSAVWWLIARPETRGVDLTWMHGTLFTIIEVWTTIILWYQTAFPIFVWNRLARPLLVALAAPVWLLVAIATNQYEFAATFVIGTFAFLDPEWVRAASRRLLGESLAERLVPSLDAPASEPSIGRSPSARKSESASRREPAGVNG